MTQLTPRELIAEQPDLVALPEIVARINAMINDPLCGTAEISRLISQDAALSARLLKVTNSPFYGFPTRIDTISMALTIIGTRQLRDLILASTVVSKFSRIPPELVSVDCFWRHNIACAAAARVLAQRLKIANTERFYVAGLLHDIGKLVMYLLRPELSRQMLRQARDLPADLPADLGALEQRLFGFGHAELGAELLRHWHLPESLVEPVACHHHPLRARQYVKETAVVHLANAIGNTIQPMLSNDDDLPIDSRVWDLLQIAPGELDALTREAELTLQHALQVMFFEVAA